MAALGFAGLSLPSYDRALHALRFWLDSWDGLGRIALGMARRASCASDRTSVVYLVFVRVMSQGFARVAP